MYVCGTHLSVVVLIAYFRSSLTGLYVQVVSVSEFFLFVCYR